jgi:anti-sigma regulatory factor (Ser/Thr protein kinase)
MIAHRQNSIAIADRSSIGEARRISSQMAERTRMSTVEGDRVPLVVTELATNLLLHAKGGEILIRMLPAELGPGLEIIALDRGPGIADVRHCMADGNSNGGTRGCGLGAIRRLSTQFDIYSIERVGTVVISRVRSGKAKLRRTQPLFSTICIPVAGEVECGDAWDLRQVDNKIVAIVADGLGHGPLAAVAAAEALTVFDGTRFDSPIEYFEAAQAPMSTTRGAAIAVAQVDLQRHTLQYSGVGNIAGTIFSVGSSKARSLLSHNGIVGSGAPKLQQFDYPWDDGDLLIMHSDGLSTRWRLTDYPGLAQADAAVIAAVLYRDARRDRDDATVLVARLGVV